MKHRIQELLDSDVKTCGQMLKTPEGYLFAWGSTLPTGAGYAPGCLFTKTDGSGATSLYKNVGDATTANFTALT